MDPLHSSDVPHATPASGSALASLFGSLDGGNDDLELPKLHSLPSVIGQQSTNFQEPLNQPRPLGTTTLVPSPPSKAGTPEGSHLARPIQVTSHQTSVHSIDTFPGNRNPEQNTVNTPSSPQLTPIDFPEPSHLENVSVQSPVQFPIPLSPDTHPYPHLTRAGRLTPQSMYLNQADSFPIASVEAPLVALEPSCTVHVQTPQDPNCHSVWLYPTKSQEPSVHENGDIPEPVMKRPLPQPVSFQRNQGGSWLAPQTVLGPDDSISMAGAPQGSRGLRASPRVHQDTTAVPPSPIVVHPGPDFPFVPAQSDHRTHQPNTPFVPIRNAHDSRTLDEKSRVVSAPLQKLPSPKRIHPSPDSAQQGTNAGTRPDIPVAPPTRDRVQDILESVDKSLAAQKQDREYWIQQLAQIAQSDGALLEEERKKVRELEETLQRLTVEAGEERRGLIMKCEEARLAAEANHGSLLSHFEQFTNRIDASLQEGAVQRQMITGYLNLKEQKRVEKDNRWATLEDTLRKVVEDDATERLRAQKQQEQQALRPGDLTYVYLKD